MNSFVRYRLRYTRKQRTALFLFVIALAATEIAGLGINHNLSPQIEFPAIEELKFAGTFPHEKDNLPDSVQNFDPNELDAAGWMRLGFSEKQTQTIIKYKYSLGGSFSSKEQIESCFVISEKKFAEIEPYIVFENSDKNENHTSGSYNHQPEQRTSYKKFNPNQYTQKDWQNLGFSEKQAASILKYKVKLGGSFTSLEQIKKCYMISDEKFNEMKPYIVLNNQPSIPKEKKPSDATIKLIEEEEEIQPASGSISVVEE